MRSRLPIAAPPPNSVGIEQPRPTAPARERGDAPLPETAVSPRDRTGIQRPAFNESANRHLATATKYHSFHRDHSRVSMQAEYRTVRRRSSSLAALLNAPTYC